MEFNKDNTALIVTNFELDPLEKPLSEDELLEVLAHQINYMIEYRMEFLLSLMYRLDIDEDRVNYALSPFAKEPPAIGIARLVIDRQKQRNATKAYYRGKSEEQKDRKGDW